MADNSPTVFAQQFSTNVQLLLQQKGSRLRSAVTTGSYVGAQASPVDQIFPVTANKVVARYAAMPRTDALLTRRWAYPVDYDLNQMIDTFDKLRMIIDPTSHYVTNAMYAIGRGMDQELINSFFGTSNTGYEGATPVTFPSSNVISVQQGAASPVGMSVAKLRQAKKLLMQNEVDLDSDPLFCAVTAKQHDDLLAEVQVIDGDYNGGKPVMEEGRISRFLGIQFIHTELLGTGTDDQAGTSTAVPIWAKSGMHLGLWNDIQADVSQRKDIQGLPWQAYVKGTFGATRIDEKRVMQVWCR